MFLEVVIYGIVLLLGTCASAVWLYVQDSEDESLRAGDEEPEHKGRVRCLHGWCVVCLHARTLSYFLTHTQVSLIDFTDSMRKDSLTENSPGAMSMLLLLVFCVLGSLV